MDFVISFGGASWTCEVCKAYLGKQQWEEF